MTSTTNGSRPALYHPPIGDLLGFNVESAAGGQASVTLEAGPEHANPMGTLHGGVLCDIADAAMGLAYHSTLRPGEAFTTLELKINFLRPHWFGRLLAAGRVVQGGNTVGLTECDITDESGRLIARATSTCMTLRGEAAAGRTAGTAQAVPGA